MYLISWEEGDEGPEGLLLAKDDKILDIDLPYASPRDPRERNEILLYNKWGTHNK
jgi:hypothetical protein